MVAFYTAFSSKGAKHEAEQSLARLFNFCQQGGRVWARVLFAVVSMLFLGTASASAEQYCLDVNSKKGWQTLSLPNGTIGRVSFSGGWSVIAGIYKPVGPRGYSGADAKSLGPLYGYKYDQSYAFGEMLVQDKAGRTVPFAEFAALAVNSRDPAGTYAFRINDQDRALWDNKGAITVCVDMR